MRFSVPVCARVVLMLTIAAALPGCGGGGSDEDAPGTNRSPQATNDVLEVTGTGATSIAVLTNDQDPDNDPLTVTIAEAPLVGTASVNADGTVRLDLPANFRGVTRFQYRITDSSGAFDTATAVAFVDAPAYRLLFAAGTSSQATELYVTDLVEPVKISNAVSGDLRLQTYAHSAKGTVVVYTRANPTNTAATTEMFLVRLNPLSAPVQIVPPTGRRFTEATAAVISADDQFVAVATDPAGIAAAPTDLYVFNVNNPGGITRVNGSENLSPAHTQFAGDTSPTLYFVAAPTTAGGASAVYRAAPGNLDSPVKVSPSYTNTSTNAAMRVVPDQSRILLLGNRAGQNGLFSLNPATALETRLTTDMAANESIENLLLSKDFTQVVYMSRAGTSANARINVVPIAGTTQTRTILSAAITRLNDLRPDADALLVTRGSGGPGANGNLVEVALDTSVADVAIATGVTGGLYDGTGSRVYVYGQSPGPGVIERSGFGRAITPLISATAPQPSFFAPIDLGQSTALLVDSTHSPSVVNAAAPGKLLQVSTLTLDTGPRLLPAAVAKAP